MTLEERVRRLEDEEAIRAMLVEFVTACDDGYNADRIAALFAEDGVLELRELGRYEGRAAIHEFFASISARLDPTHHFQANYLIDLDADGLSARGRWYGFEMPTFDGRATWVAATYDDRYVKEGDRWRIALFNQTLHFFCDYDKGWVEERVVPL